MSHALGDLHLQLYSSSAAPKRDYHGLTITSEFVILNSWDISHGPHVFPKRCKIPLDELQQDRNLQQDILALFGEHVLNYSLRLSRCERNLQCLPHVLFLYLVRLLASNDIIRLSQTSKIFFEICNTNPVWKILYRKRMKRLPTKEELAKSEKQSWRHMLRRKLTEKLANTIISDNFKKSLNTKKDESLLKEIQLYSKPHVPFRRKPPPEILPKQLIQIKLIENIPEVSDDLRNERDLNRSAIALPNKNNMLLRIKKDNSATLKTPSKNKQSNALLTDTTRVPTQENTLMKDNLPPSKIVKNNNLLLKNKLPNFDSKLLNKNIGANNLKVKSAYNLQNTVLEHSRSSSQVDVGKIKPITKSKIMDVKLKPILKRK